ncbi:MAG: hypothetical protein IPQ05_17205 [Leptospiraceae bacterium]|nr:hypothetical protein [Leptospiraceae bacterium]
MNQFILFLILFISLNSLFAEEVIRGVRYLKPNASFSEVSDLYIQNGFLTRITESKQKENVRYVLPSFCDAYVNFGVDATGGQSNLAGLRLPSNPSSTMDSHMFNLSQTVHGFIRLNRILIQER